MTPFVVSGSVTVVDHHLSPDSLSVLGTLEADNLKGLLRPQLPRMRD